jgi:putative hydrolase
MYNLHAHSLLSDGALLPSEVAVRYAAAGYQILAITDHVDYSNIKTTVKAIVDFTRRWPKGSAIKVLPGVELTHIPPQQFKPLAKYARENGIKIIVAHGETPVEPVAAGTNRAALEADIDILAHPGNITDPDALFAKKRGIFLEVTSRHGHNTTNEFVVKICRRLGVKMVLNNDSHEPDDIITPARLRAVGVSAGLTEEEINPIYNEVGAFLKGK